MSATGTKPLPARLREMWDNAARNNMSRADCAESEQREVDAFAKTWARSLVLPGETDLVHSTLVELGRRRKISDLAEVKRRCEASLADLNRQWQQTVPEVDARNVERYYDNADLCIEELIWWHTLQDDKSPLSYVTALELATGAKGRKYLDFGSGVGSGALLFQDHGFDVTLADISSVMLEFCRWRFETRKRPAKFLDLKTAALPASSFDFITAMDVFEHLVDPVATLDALDRSLKPGGIIYGRFAAEEDEDRPQHIVHDFAPVLARFAALGFKEVMRDDWLWGHIAFQKPA